MPSQNLHTPWVEDVLRFWFEELGPEERFKSDPQLDAKIRSRFGELYAAFKARPPEPSQLDPKALLAAVIVFDQFPRNIFRRSVDAYATDELALELAEHAVATGKDRALEKEQRHFIYMPYMHVRHVDKMALLLLDRAMQTESLRLFSALGVEEGMKYARHHAGIVERFGHFPHRNEILGRPSTLEETEFLKTEPPLV